MSNAMKIALTFTAIDAASGMMRMLENRILGMGKAAQSVRKDFEAMVSHTQAGLKSLAASVAILNELKPGIRIAASMEEAIDNLKMSLQTAGKPAAQLTKELQKAREVADDLQKITPFSSRQIVQSETMLSRAGIRWEDIMAPKGAAYAASTLATIMSDKGMTPETASEMLTKTAIAFHLRGSQFGNLADIYQRVLTTTILGQHPESFTTGIGNLAGVAATMGLTPRQAVQFLATVAGSVANPEEAGTYAKDFLLRLTGARKTQKEEMEKLGLHFFDQQGNLKPFQGVIDELRGKTSRLNQKELTEAIFKVFGIQGLQAALALRRTGMGSYEDVGTHLNKTSDISTKLATRLEGLDANLKSLAGTTESAVANAFNPMLHTLTGMTKAANDFVDAGGKYAGRHQDVMKAVDWSIAGIGAGAAGYGLYRLLRAGVSGAAMFRGLRSTGLAVAEGKALEKIAGVTPVFVVNWPGRDIQMPGAEKSGPVLYDRYGNPITRNAAAETSGAASNAAKVGAGGGFWLGPLVGITATMAAASLSVGYDFMKAHPENPFLDPFEPVGRTWVARDSEARQTTNALRATTLHVEDPKLEGTLSKMEGILRQKIKNEIVLNIRVDQNGRVSAQSNDADTTARINLKRGEFLPVP
jgi:TP901 family phage tail tape measure protein